MAHRRRSLVMMSLAAALFISLALASSAIAAPQILNYQGNLYKDGQPVTATKTMVFRIYAEADDALAEALWNSGNVSVTVTNGVFSVTLGASPQPAFPANLFDSDTRFLGIMVDGVEMTERKRLASVPYAMSGGIPQGVIVMWSGSAAQIPSGWALCNGQYGTPDLRDRFVIGGGGTYSVGATGGSATKNLSHTHTGPSHTHSYVHTHELGHTHTYSGTTSSGGNHSHSGHQSGGHSSDNGFDGGPYYVGTNDVSHTHTWSGTTSDANDATTDSQSTSTTGASGTAATGSGGSATQDIMPPYYALCFIMKL